MEHKYVSLLHNFASIVFTFGCIATLPGSSVLKEIDDMFAFIIDSTTVRPSTTIIIPIQVHPDFISGFRHTFKANAWLKALQLHPDDMFVHRIVDGITWGRSLNFTGDRMAPRLCKNRKKATLYATEIEICIEKERINGFRSGPFRSTLPLFNLKCHPRSAAVKNFSESVL